MKYIFLTMYVLVGVSSRNSLPDWVPLDCEWDVGVDGGHQYFFSDTKLSWFDASDECNLYGGYLLALGSQYEQNCLLKYGKTANIANWYWHQGI